MVQSVIKTESPHRCDITIYKGEDWYDAVPALIDPVSLNPINFNDYPDLAFDLWIKPAYDYSSSIDRLTSISSDGIIIESVSEALIALYREADDVDNYPIGQWKQFLNMSWTYGSGFDTITKTLWRGFIFIKPGRRQE